VQPVAGTAAATTAADLAAAGARARPHTLLDDDLASRPKRPKQRVPKDMGPEEIADRIVATLLRGSGPILLSVPGTLSDAWQSSMLTISRAFVRQANGPVSVASIPYANGVVDVVRRFLGRVPEPSENVLAHVLRKLRAAAPHRPILLTGESQGAWFIADTLRADPQLAAAVTRVAVFATPGFVRLPEAVGSARLGASLLPGTAAGGSGVLDVRHTDDIVPSLFNRLHPRLLAPWVQSLTSGRGMQYPPHHYDWHGEEAARFLLTGIRPEEPAVHESTTHPMRPKRY
jgi:hypothetical protein